MATPIFLDAVIGARIIAETVRAMVCDVSPTMSDIEVKAQVCALEATERLEWKPLVLPMAQERALVLVLCGVTPTGSRLDGPTRESWVVYRSSWDGKSRNVTLRNGTQTVTTTTILETEIEA
jgi:hypothetical protein